MDNIKSIGEKISSIEYMGANVGEALVRTDNSSRRMDIVITKEEFLLCYKKWVLNEDIKEPVDEVENPEDILAQKEKDKIINNLIIGGDTLYNKLCSVTKSNNGLSISYESGKRTGQLSYNFILMDIKDGEFSKLELNKRYEAKELGIE